MILDILVVLWVLVLTIVLRVLLTVVRKTGERVSTLEPRLGAVETNLHTLTTAPTPVHRVCVVRTFRFADGHMMEKHSTCIGVQLETLTTEWAQEQHPSSPVVKSSDSQHFMAV